MSRKTKMGFAVVGMALAVVAIFGAIGFIWLSKMRKLGEQFASRPPETATVTAAEAKKETWKPTIHAIGSVEAIQGVTISSEVSGRVVEILFQSGTHADAGTPLVKLDISTEEADLKRAEAEAALAKTNLERARELRNKQANSTADLDTAQAEMKKAEAAADLIRTTIEKKTIRAPFSGELGIRLVNLGEQLVPGARVVWIQTIDPIFVDFALPQQKLADISLGQDVLVNSDAFGQETFKGTISAINPAVDADTKNIRLQATLTNENGKLLPGMFVSVDLILPKEQQLITIPITSISYNPYGNFVYVLSEKKDAGGQSYLEAAKQTVKLGERRGDQVSVLSGVEEGQQVITSGQMKIRPGIRVAVDNKISPSNNPDPHPVDT